jgi:hypothetical protein
VRFDVLNHHERCDSVETGREINGDSKKRSSEIQLKRFHHAKRWRGNVTVETNVLRP